MAKLRSLLHDYFRPENTHLGRARSDVFSELDELDDEAWAQVIDFPRPGPRLGRDPVPGRGLDWADPAMRAKCSPGALREVAG
jgi:hypothetical protein